MYSVSSFLITFSFFLYGVGVPNKILDTNIKVRFIGKKKLNKKDEKMGYVTLCRISCYDPKA